MEALLAVTFLGYMIAAAAFVAALYDAQWKRWAFSSLAVGWGAQTAWLVREGFQRGLWPITTMYDWTAGFVWLSIVAFVFYQRLRPTWPLGGFLMPVVVVVWLGGQVLPRTPGTSTVLVSSIASMAAYVAFLIAAVFSVMYFEKERELKWKKVRVFYYQLPSLDVMDMVILAPMPNLWIRMSCGCVQKWVIFKANIFLLLMFRAMWLTRNGLGAKQDSV
ncbi:hypothetical protein [Sulfobacillus thermotolerans]|uniref:hypothetical protein n=1 Tax=Sulfobacillus thermotolerans TaxID=338644 RepID=UPI00336741C4